MAGAEKEADSPQDQLVDWVGVRGSKDRVLDSGLSRWGDAGGIFPRWGPRGRCGFGDQPCGVSAV